MSQAYDYIVAGGGSAGCTLAARLAEDPSVTVLLAEAGGPGRSPFIDMPAGNGFLFGNPDYDWCLQSVPQPGLGGRRVSYPRGRGLGGTSIMNGMIYIRGNARDYDSWRQRGLTGWGYADVLPYFRRSEGSTHRSGIYHGADGPLKTCAAANFTPIDRMFLQAAQQAGLPLNDDFNGPSQVGAGRFDVKVSGGCRQSAARAYLSRRPANLTVRASARVTGIEIDRGRATGLRLGAELVRARREVILCLGTFGSPQLLMLSGIGPADHLRAHDIPVAADLPGVGQNLADHINVPLQYTCTDPDLSFARYQRLDRALWLGLRWFLTRRGPGAAPFWSVGLFDAMEDSGHPDLQVFFTPMTVKEAKDEGDTDDTSLLDRLGHRLLVRGSKMAVAGFQIDINQMRPDGRGEVRLASSDPLAPPVIDPRYFSGAREMRQLVAGLKRMRSLVAQSAFDGVRGEELSPGLQVRKDAEIEAAIRRIATTAHHPVGTCKMGVDTDPMAVLDAELRVRGIEGLRVCDASAFPDQITGNTNAPVIMAAEKAADMILGRPPLAAADIPEAAQS